jgi:multicomponent Na+:H+ antiporter subunit F
MTPLVILIVLASLVAVALAVARLLLGPSQADRIIALDVVFSASIALTVAAALASERTLYLDIAIGLSIIGFVATMVWARLIDKTTKGPS